MSDNEEETCEPAKTCAVIVATHAALYVNAPLAPEQKPTRAEAPSVSFLAPTLVVLACATVPARCSRNPRESGGPRRGGPLSLCGLPRLAGPHPPIFSQNYKLTCRAKTKRTVLSSKLFISRLWNVKQKWHDEVRAPI